MRTCAFALVVVALFWWRPAMSDAASKLPPATQPLPTMTAARVDKDFPLDADLTKPIWRKATPVRVERTLREANLKSELSTTVRCLWSDQYLYLSYECPYTRLTTFEPPMPPGKKRLGLWDRDVVEAFIGSDLNRIGRYAEFEVAPTNERIDLLIERPKSNFDWTSHFESAAKVDSQAKVWTVELRIPLSALSEVKPKAGTRWRINLYRSDRAANVFLAWSPAMTPSAHTPERFGFLEFQE